MNTLRQTTTVRPTTAAQPQRQAKGRRSSPAGSSAAHEAPPAPHIFVPASVPPRDLSRLFNLRTRPGYYNADAKLALLRRAKQPPHDELLIDFSKSEAEIELAAAGLPLGSGPWTWEASAAGQPLAARGEWSAAAWRR